MIVAPPKPSRLELTSSEVKQLVRTGSLSKPLIDPRQKIREQVALDIADAQKAIERIEQEIARLELELPVARQSLANLIAWELRQETAGADEKAR